MTCFEEIEKCLDACLQRDLEITIGSKTVRRGCFILYTIKDYYLTLIIKTPQTNKTYDVLYPFGVEYDDDNIMFHYNNNLLAAPENEAGHDLISDVCVDCAHKVLNNTLTLRFA